jgi:hypothetical protein
VGAAATCLFVWALMRRCRAHDILKAMGDLSPGGDWTGSNAPQPQEKLTTNAILIPLPDETGPISARSLLFPKSLELENETDSIQWWCV